jgi:hypothetical protein
MYQMEFNSFGNYNGLSFDRAFMGFVDNLFFSTKSDKSLARFVLSANDKGKIQILFDPVGF